MMMTTCSIFWIPCRDEAARCHGSAARPAAAAARSAAPRTRMGGIRARASGAAGVVGVVGGGSRRGSRLFILRLLLDRAEAARCGLPDRETRGAPDSGAAV